MTIQAVIAQLVEQHGRHAPLCLHIPDHPHQVRVAFHRNWIDIGLYQRGTGEYAGTLIPLFELLLTDGVPTEIRWSLAFWDDEGAAVDHAWFAQHCADHLVTTGWLTAAQVMAEEARP